MELIEINVCFDCHLSFGRGVKHCTDCGGPTRVGFIQSVVLEALLTPHLPIVSDIHTPAGIGSVKVQGMEKCPKCMYPLSHGKQTSCPGCHTQLHWTCRGGQRTPGGCSCGTADAMRVIRAGRLSVGDPCDHCGVQLHNLNPGITIIRSLNEPPVTLNICTTHVPLFEGTGFWKVDAVAKAPK